MDLDKRYKIYFREVDCFIDEKECFEHEYYMLPRVGEEIESSYIHKNGFQLCLTVVEIRHEYSRTNNCYMPCLVLGCDDIDDFTNYYSLRNS